MSELEHAHRAVERSRSQRYLSDYDDASRELTSAIEALRALESRLRRNPPTGEERARLARELNLFKSELNLAERLHEHAASWEARWANAVHDALGLHAASYGPGGSPVSSSVRRQTWEG